MTKRLFISLTNIPSPYRAHFYSSLEGTLRTKGISLQVIFMARTEPGRHWIIEPAAMKFDYEVVNGFHPTIGNRNFHFNPMILGRLVSNPPDWLLVSGSWFLPTVQMASLIASLSKAKLLFWSESNLAYVKHRSWLANTWRKLAMNRYDAYVIPGKWARQYVLEFSSTANKKPFLTLPNIVDEGLFRDGVANLRPRRKDLQKKWDVEKPGDLFLFTAARLEPIKGIKELIMALVSSTMLNEITLLVSGTGTQRNELETIVRKSGLEKKVRFLGFLDQAEILELLSVADGFILPSLGDPYPLAVIEAAFAGLPLLLSNRVGSHPETLIPGVNGLLFDPLKSVSIKDALDRFTKIGHEKRKEMGIKSLELAEAHFSSDLVVPQFVEDILKL